MERSNFNIVNLNEFSWYLNVALMGGAFAVFALIYNVDFIYYGLITFAFGVLAHVAGLFFDWVFLKNGGTTNRSYWIAHLINAILAVLWIVVLLRIY